jgi:hypothetical protein
VQSVIYATIERIAMKILGIDIPDKCLSPTIKNTDWRPEPLSNISDISPKWIGARIYQIHPLIIRQIFDIETELNLIQRRQSTLNTINYLLDSFHALGQVNAIHASRSEFTNELLGALRALYIVDCLLCNAPEYSPDE